MSSLFVGDGKFEAYLLLMEAAASLQLNMSLGLMETAFVDALRSSFLEKKWGELNELFFLWT